MKKITKIHRYMIGLSVILLLFIVLSLTLFSSKDINGMITNIAVIIVMVALAFAGINYPKRWFKGNGIASLLDATVNLEKAKLIITRKNEPESWLVGSDIEGKSFFTHPVLDKAYCKFCEEQSLLKSGDSDYQYCDISNYLNEELIAEIAHESYNDIIGNTMTGLGILGTFIGLSFGLRSFSTGSAAEMMSTISPLIDGIKVAFFTSIAGISLSLVFNHFYRNDIKAAEEALDSFLDSYYKVNPHSENEGLTKLVAYQEQQTRSMTQFANEVSASFATNLKDSILPTVEAIPAAVTEAVQAGFRPAVELFETLTDRLASIQDQNMEKIASEFVKHMDEAMGSELDHLGATIQVLCTQNEETAEKMLVIFDKLESSTKRLNDIETGIGHSVESMSEFIKTLNAFQTTLQEKMESFVERIATAQESALSAYTQSCNLMQDGMRTAANSAADTIRSAGEFLTESVKATVESMESSCADLINSTSACADHLSILVENEQKSLELINQINNQTEKMINGIADDLSSLGGGFTEEYRALTNELTQAQNNLYESLRKQETALSETLNQNAEALLNTLREETQRTAQVLSEHTEQLHLDVERVDKLQQTIANSLSAVAEQLSNSAASMRNASEDLSSNLDGAMGRTFKQIDKYLAETVMHLSGTLHEMNDVVEKMPAMAKLTSKQLREETNNYLSSIRNEIEMLKKSIEGQKIGKQ